jgi:hypothetical protein
MVAVPKFKVPVTKIAGIDAAALEGDKEKNNADTSDA